MARRDATVTDMAEAHNEVLPRSEDQLVIFSQLLESIDYCEKLGSPAWSLTLQEWGFRLNVGNVEAMTCHFTYWPAEEFDIEKDATLVTLRLILVGADCMDRELPGDDVGEISEINYPVVGEKSWCYEGLFLTHSDETHESRGFVEQHLSTLQDNHRRFLNLACRSPKGILRRRSNYAQHHCEGLLAYARLVVGGAELAPHAGDMRA